MKLPIKVVVVLAIAGPVVSFAQTSQQSLTRAQVRADVIQAEKAGYSPTAWADFPEGELQAAQFRAAQKTSAARATGYGSDWSGSSQAGAIAR